ALHAACRAALAATPQQQLGDYQRQGKQEYRRQVDKNEGPAAVLTRGVGETPDVRQAHRRTDGCQQEEPAGCPVCLRLAVAHVAPGNAERTVPREPTREGQSPASRRRLPRPAL